MDIAGIINNEQLFDLELRHPVTDELLGIHFDIRSAASAEAKKVLRKHIDETLERRQRGATAKSTELERQEVEKAASYIAGWNWGEHTVGGEKPVFSMKAAVALLDKQGWIFAQVVAAATKLANFTQPLETASSPQSG